MLTLYTLHTCGLRHMMPIDYFGFMVMLLIATDFCEKIVR
jgi:hypothetical protein